MLYVCKIISFKRMSINTFRLPLQAEFDASELITQREVVSQRVSELLMDRGETFGLILDDISIVSDRAWPYYAEDCP